MTSIRLPLQKRGADGFSLVEVLVSTAVFLVIAVAVYQSYAGLLNLVRLARIKIAAADLVNERFEIIRNMPYANIGLVNGVPSGTLQRNATFVRDGITFETTTSIQNVDDPFDGTLVTSPVDSAPADYKLIEVNVACSTCVNFTPMNFTGRVMPKNLEIATNNGSIVIRVFDSSGNPVPNATVHITNSTNNPVIDITDVTDVNGIYELIDTPPVQNGYHIVITKNGYSSDQTYTNGGQTNPNPTVGDGTVVQQGVTQISFFIDRTSTINVSSVRPNCTAISDIDFHVQGSKIIGKDTSNQPIYKYDQDLKTNNSGSKVLSPLEWDTYSFDLTDSDYVLAGTISPLPVNLLPNTTQNVTLVVSPRQNKSLLFSIKDAVSSLPQASATVHITNNGSIDETLVTGRGSLSQTDWAGGSGQILYTDTDKYLSQDGNIEVNSPSGELQLSQAFGLYQTHGELTSSTFDTGSASNFYQLVWNPGTQPAQTGTPNVRFQIATNNDNATWNFTGPDGTGATYYDINNTTISSTNNGNRYLRYKVFLDTASNLVTPTVTDIAFTYTSSCVPPGQVLFDSLPNGSYDYTVTKAGYQQFNGTVGVNNSSLWQNVDVLLQTQ